MSNAHSTSDVKKSVRTRYRPWILLAATLIILCGSAAGIGYVAYRIALFIAPTLPIWMVYIFSVVTAILVLLKCLRGIMTVIGSQRPQLKTRVHGAKSLVQLSTAYASYSLH